jgi:hypothetical protein
MDSEFPVDTMTRRLFLAQVAGAAMATALPAPQIVDIAPRSVAD